VSAPVFILGTGGHARDVADVVAALGRRPVFVTHDPALREQWTGTDEIAIEAEVMTIGGCEFAMGIGENAARRRLAAKFPDLSFPTLIHPDTSFGRGQRSAVQACIGTLVFAGTRLGSNIRVGAFCTFNLNSTVSHDCEIGDFANLSPGVNVAGNVRIEDGAWIGTGVAINQGNDARKLTIGANTVIGSGAVVLHDCDAGSVYVGVPARKVR
jgi:sugar O-acyltransferase (sialic acid O-acetyltransferase NeuD family)